MIMLIRTSLGLPHKLQLPQQLLPCIETNRATLGSILDACFYREILP